MGNTTRKAPTDDHGARSPTLDVNLHKSEVSVFVLIFFTIQFRMPSKEPSNYPHRYLVSLMVDSMCSLIWSKMPGVLRDLFFWMSS